VYVAHGKGLEGHGRVRMHCYTGTCIMVAWTASWNPHNCGWR